MKKKPAKPRLGRPPLPPELKRKYIQVTLPPEAIAWARELGQGNVSRGIEIALARAG